MNRDFDFNRFSDEVLGPMPPDTPERHRAKQDSPESQALSERWGEIARGIAKETDMNAGFTPPADYVEFLEDNIRDALEKEHKQATEAVTTENERLRVMNRELSRIHERLRGSLEHAEAVLSRGRPSTAERIDLLNDLRDALSMDTDTEIEEAIARTALTGDGAPPQAREGEGS